MTDDDTPLIAVLGTGGTIASRKDAHGAASPALGGEELLALLPPLRVRLRPQEVLAKDSSALTLADMQHISASVAAQLSDTDVAGVVVLHGTDAMEETSLLVQLQHQPQKPVIFTGAQFAADHPRSDGIGNLADAVRMAMAGKDGVRLAFAGRELPCWGLYKRTTDLADAFALAGPVPAPALPRLPADVGATRLDIVAIHPGCDAAHLDASLDRGADGVVIAALGSGNASPEIVAAIQRASARGVPVVISSRVPEGEMAPIYGGGGGGHDMAAAGAIHARWLRPGQARILLAVLLANGCDRDRIRAAFG